MNVQSDFYFERLTGSCWAHPLEALLPRPLQQVENTFSGKLGHVVSGYLECQRGVGDPTLTFKRLSSNYGHSGLMRLIWDLFVFCRVESPY